MSSKPTFAPAHASDIEAFDHETDVLVVGFGCAGGAAALEAAGSGADVLVIERAGGPGGSSAMSGGELYLGGGTPLQQSSGYRDSPDNMFAYLKAALGPDADEEKIRLYCDGSREHFDWFCGLGLTFNPGLYDGQSWMPPTQDGLMWLGENAWPYDRLADAVPRGHRPATESFGGWLIMEKLVAAVKAAGVETHVDTVATRLVLDDDGRVVGVVARQYGTTVTYRARKAVIVTTGGFVDNEEMLFEHAPVLSGHAKVSDGLDDGSGISMGLAIGAAVRRMSVTQIAAQVLPAMIARGMLVNGLGQRFINEDVYPGLASVAAVRHQPGPYWVIIDQEGYDDIPERDLWNVRPSHVCERLGELEEELGLPEGSLESTVAAYNHWAERGEDPQFHKNKRWLRSLKAPFAAIDPRKGFDSGSEGGGGTTGVAGFTLGGLRTTVDGRVLDVSGNEIPGLYAAGRASAGMFGQGYISGTSLGDGTFFGRRAGRAAAVGIGNTTSDSGAQDAG
ncbi:MULTISPECIES: FAD-dependent oxidoreductase [unclassified Nocardioides]|uniref:FAD-dependent oxidoreductase n=1 Tax=unclassified Nocardioides TaxID=2615069 RepID=UPI0006FEC8CA|nr:MULTISPECIES: FAD-dependent oxidoreductase [unclassified Nocardioides]KQY54288.1 fumarate reductase [Nocardioides sp. Root140]KRF10444.1 fumarate reductase [Nocardioides sp. Soil796]